MARSARTGSTTEPQNGVKLNRSVQRVIKILQAFDVERPELSLSEISEIVELPESTVYRLLLTLQQAGFIEKESTGSSRYHLGAELFRLGSIVVQRMRLGRNVVPYMEQLAQATAETVNLGVLRGFAVLYIEKIESSQPLRASLTVGSATVPAHASAIGKVLLAHLPPDRLQELLDATPLTRHGPNSITNRDDLERELATIRSRGYSVDDLEFAPDIRAIAAPIRDRHAEVIAGISVAGPATRLSLERVHEIAPLVLAAAEAISRHLGYYATT